MSRHLLKAVVLLSFPAIALADEPPTPPPFERLSPGVTIEREISGRRVDAFSVRLLPQEAADLTIEQRGADVYVRIVDDAGVVVVEADRESRPNGTEHLPLYSEEGGVLRVEIRARYAALPAGNYAVTLSPSRAADARDRDLFKAAKASTGSETLSIAGKLVDARASAERALALGEKALGAEDPWIATLSGQLANLNRMLGNYPEARQQYERAASIAEKTLGADSPLRGDVIGGVALTWIAENDYAKAEPLLHEALAITERTLGTTHPRIIHRLMNLGVLYQNLEDTHTAIAILERAVRIAEKTLDPAEYQYIGIVNNLGALHRELGDYDRARPMLERALRMVENRYGLEHPYVAIPLQELGIIERETKNYAGALSLLWRAEAAREKALGLRHQLTMASLIVIANVYRAQGEYERAIELQESILTTLHEFVGPYHSLTLLTLANLARTHAAAGATSCAIEYQQRMDAVLEKNLQLKLAIGSERQKLEFADSAAERTDRTISLHVQHAADHPSMTEHALLVLLQRKARVLDAMSHNMETLRETLDPEHRLLLDRLRATTSELATLAMSGPGKKPMDEFRASLNALETEKESLERRISAVSAAFDAESHAVTLEDVRAAIPPSAALIEFALYRPFDPASPSDADDFEAPHYVAYVVRRDGPIAWKDLGDADAIDDAIARWRLALRDALNRDVDSLGRKLDRMLMQPIAPLLGNASQLLISPDSQLALVPFEALVDARGRYRVQRYSISYLASGRDLLRLRVPREGRTPPVVIADPLFGEPVQLASAKNSRAGAADASTMYFGPLAGTREEARSIHELFPEARVFTGSEASKAALRRLDGPAILHVATHGFFLDHPTRDTTAQKATGGTRSVRARSLTANPLLRAGIALTGANLDGRRSGEGVLTALEASTLNLWGTKLVTLSACDSGVGEVKNQEGVYGLGRAFFLAGAETVVMSLWPVSDYVTRRTMTSYYSGLRRGLGRGEALRQARLDLLRQPSRRHPFYWASFIQSGDWRPLQ